MVASQPLFYRTIVSVNRDAHAAKRVRTGGATFGFASGSHLIPAVIDEFAAACRHLPVVFMPDAEAPTPVFLVGVRSGENLLVEESGVWRGRYVPAFLRRYPFILGEVSQADPVLCLDEESPLLSETEGEPLFDGGQESGFLKEKIALVSGYFDAARRTEAGVRLLRELDLFQVVNLEFQAAGGGTNAIHGLWAVDEAKLQALPDDQVLRLHQERLLGPVYAHLLSLAAVEVLGDMNRTLN